MGERVMIFIDGSNLYHSLKNHFNRPDLDIGRFRRKLLNRRQLPPYEKGTDVQLATDMITHSYKGNYDVGILVAGDNDFAGAVQAVKDNGKHVEVALFGRQGTSQELRSVADMVVPISARYLK